MTQGTAGPHQHEEHETPCLAQSIIPPLLTRVTPNRAACPSVRSTTATPCALSPRVESRLCQAPGASPENCWLDFRSCRKAEIARRVYAYSTLGESDLSGNPTVGVVTTDEVGRQYVCLHRRGQWVHEGDHDLPVNVQVTASGPIG